MKVPPLSRRVASHQTFMTFNFGGHGPKVATSLFSVDRPVRRDIFVLRPIFAPGGIFGRICKYFRQIAGKNLVGVVMDGTRVDIS